MPTFKQLEAFVCMADAGSISGAARRLSIAQSAASKHVSEFEALFARPLLDRTGKGAELTVEGAEVLMRARTVLARRDALLFALSSRELPRRRLRLGVTEVIALTWLNKLLEALRTAFPHVTVELKVEVSIALREQLRGGDLDAVVVPDAARTPGLFRANLGSLANQWYASPSLYRGRKVLKRADLSRFDLLTQGSMARSGVPLQDWLNAESITPRSIISSSSLMAVLDMMVSGMGIALLPEPLVRELLVRRQVTELPVRPLQPSVNYVLLMREEESSHLHLRLKDVATQACDFTVTSKELATARYREHALKGMR